MAGNKWQISDELWEKMAPSSRSIELNTRWVRTASGLIIALQ